MRSLAWEHRVGCSLFLIKLKYSTWRIAYLGKVYLNQDSDEFAVVVDEERDQLDRQFLEKSELG